MDNVISDVTDEMGELARDTGKKFVRDVVKGIPQTAKKQIAGDQTSQSGDAGDMAQDKTRLPDPVTGKPIPTKKVLSDLKNATAQVAQVKLKQIREELEKQRLKTSQPADAKARAGEAGPEVPQEPEKPKEDVIAKTLKQSKSTGEFGKNIGG